VVTSCFLQEGQVREQEVPHNTKHLPLFSRGGLGASWSQPSGLAPVSVWADFLQALVSSRGSQPAVGHGRCVPAPDGYAVLLVSPCTSLLFIYPPAPGTALSVFIAATSVCCFKTSLLGWPVFVCFVFSYLGPRHAPAPGTQSVLLGAPRWYCLKRVSCASASAWESACRCKWRSQSPAIGRRAEKC
jgi:hypothetical protein